MKSGIVKVIPPPEWVAAQPRLDEAIKTIRVKEPIKQDIMGTSGTYRQANILHQRSYNLPQWRQLCEQSEHQPPAKRGERRLNQDKPSKPTPRSKPSGTPSSGSKKKGVGRSNKAKGKTVTVESNDGASTPDRLPTPVSPTMKPEEDAHIKEEVDDGCDTPTKTKGGRQPKAISVSSRRKYNRRETAAVDEAAFKDFKYELEGEDYSPERCEELERAYWKTLTYAPPLYGADMPGTLFDDRTTTWNLGKLENLLDVLGTKIPGVNTAYLYLGMWKATFAWHLEDVDLFSINYLHFGAPKQWYSISQGDARRFEAAMKAIWPTDAKACDQFLRHKTFLISPAHLLSNFNIKVNKIVHHPGEFVITFPYGYHSGYNLGYNCAEAVNFALDSWLEFGRVAKKCDCSQAQDSVWIDVREIERKLRGEETEYEETDEEEEEDEDEDNENGPTDLPTPPESSGDTKTKASRKKRKRPTNENGDKLNVKRIRVRIKAPTREPCILCPNDIPSEPLLLTEDGQKAHRICAMYIPETSIESGEKDTVIDVKYIDKARLDLKCNYCRSKKGACFQCSQKKCTRAYHATCAAAAGVLVEQGEIPVFGEDGTEYKEWGIEFSCRFHRTKRDKKFDGDALGDDERILKAASELKVGEVCQMQYYRGDIFAGAVVENRRSEEMVLVDILPRGYVEPSEPFDTISVSTNHFTVNESRWNINGCSFQTLPTTVCQSLHQTQSQCRSLTRTKNHLTPASVKLMTYHVLMILSSRVLLGLSSRARGSCATLLKLRWIWRKTTRFGFTLARLLRRQKHNSQKIRRIHDTTRRVISSTQFPSLHLLHHDSLMLLPTLRISVRMLWQRLKRQVGLLSLRLRALLGQRSHMYTSLETLVICTVLIHKLTVLSKTSFSDQPHIVLVPIRDGDHQSRTRQTHIRTITRLWPTFRRHQEAIPLLLLPRRPHTDLLIQLQRHPRQIILSTADLKAQDQILLPNIHTCKRNTTGLHWNTRVLTDLEVDS
jgi:hypothetical protein